MYLKYARSKLLSCLLIQIILMACPVYAQEYEPSDDLYFPFLTVQDRRSFNELRKRALDGFGAYRKVGHKHAGLDIKAGFGEDVYSIGKGKVVKIYDKFPYQAVVVEHKLTSGEIFYSSYTHVEDIAVKVGDVVDEKTHIGRVLNKIEYKKTHFPHSHLHLEIRKTLENYNRISIRCYTMTDLHKNFHDPLKFLKQHLAR